MKILFDNKTKTASLLSSDADPNYPVDNLKSPFLKKKFQATGSKAVVEMLWGTPVAVDSIFIGYTNCATVRVRLYLAGLFQGQWLVTDAVSFTAVQADSAYIDLDVDGEKVINGNFADGSTGWTLGTGARVRQQGWVCRRAHYTSGSELDETVANATLLPAGTGRTATIITAVRRSTSNASSIVAGINLFNGPSTYVETKSNSYSAGDGADWVVKTSTQAISDSADRAYIVGQSINQTSGESFYGFILAIVNGVVIGTNWDFADGSFRYNLSSGTTITYDPSTAYMGNAMPGGSDKALVVNGGGSGSAIGDSFPVVSGQQFTSTIYAKELVSAGDPVFRLRFADAGGSELSSQSFTVTGATSNYAAFTISATAPANAASARWQADITSDDGLWFVGSVSVSRVLTTPAYLGGIGIGSAYAIDPPESFWDETFDDRSIVSESDGGQVLQEYTQPLRVYQFSVPTLTREEARACETLYIQCGRGKTIWLDPETDDLPPLYCSLVDSLVVNKNKRQYTARLNFREAR